MDISELEQLGISREDIIGRVLDRLADRVLNLRCGGTDEDGHEIEYDVESPLALELQKHMRERIDAGLREIAEKHILPNVGQYIENVTLQATNQWGEKKGTPLTFVEYLVARAESYLTEKVDFQGRSQGEDSSYNWHGTQTRITHLVHKHLHYSIEQAMANALKSGMIDLTKGIEETVKLKLAEISQKLTVKVESK